MNSEQKDFLLTLLRLMRDGKIKYNPQYFKVTIDKIEIESLIQEMENKESPINLENEIKEGIVFTPKCGDFFYNNKMKIVKVTEQDDDGFVYWVSENPKKDNRKKDNKRWNKGYCRVWWFKEYCKVVGK